MGGARSRLGSVWGWSAARREGERDMRHATKGGETGRNGESYKGGQFLPETTNPKRPGSKPAKPRKIEIEPYRYVESTGRSIYGIVGALCHRIGADGKLRPLPDEHPVWFGRDRAYYVALAERYNCGERILP